MLPIQNIYDGSILRDIDDKALKLLYFIIKTLSFPKNAFIIDLTGGSYLYNLLGKTHYPSLNDFREDIVRNMINYGLSETEARELLLLIESMELNLKYLVKDPTTNEYGLLSAYKELKHNPHERFSFVEKQFIKCL